MDRADEHHALRIDRECVDCLQNAVLNRVIELKAPDYVICAKGLECQLAAGLFLDRRAPVLEDLKAVSAGPAALDPPRGAVRGRARDMGCSESGTACTGQSADRAAARILASIPPKLPMPPLALLALYRVGCRNIEKSSSLTGTYAIWMGNMTNPGGAGAPCRSAEQSNQTPSVGP